MRTDAEQAWELQRRLDRSRIVRCPRFRTAHIPWADPVDGYCALSHSCGQFAIPTVGEFESYCTAPRYARCPRYRTMADAPLPLPDEDRSRDPRRGGQRASPRT